MLEGLKKIEGSKNYYQSPDGRVYSLKELKPTIKRGKKYYRLVDENGNTYSISSEELMINAREICLF